MPKFYRQNKKRIDPRYFLNETTNRDEEELLNEIRSTTDRGGSETMYTDQHRDISDWDASSVNSDESALLQQLKKEFDASGEGLDGFFRGLGHRSRGRGSNLLPNDHPYMKLLGLGYEGADMKVELEALGSQSQQEIPDEVEDKIRDILDSDSDPGADFRKWKRNIAPPDPHDDPRWHEGD